VHDELRGLRGEPKHHVDHALGAFANGFDDPRDYYEWFMAPDKAEQYLAEVGAAS
jgi:hypothetical protein